MNETPFFFQGIGYNLFGVLHLPKQKIKNTAFLFCHPFGEEKLWTHLIYVNFARELAHRGYPVLRFDYMGNGDSDGNFKDSSVETNLSDIHCALQVLREKVGSSSWLGLIGLRFGATLAALAAENESGINRLVLWEPIVNGAQYMQELLRINLTSQMAIYKEIRENREALVQAMKEGQTANVDGYEITWEMFEQVSSINLLDRLKQAQPNCLIVQISPRQQEFKKDLSLLNSRYQNGHALITMEEPFWKEIRAFYSSAQRLYQDTLTWLEQHDNEL